MDAFHAGKSQDEACKLEFRSLIIASIVIQFFQQLPEKELER